MLEHGVDLGARMCRRVFVAVVLILSIMAPTPVSAHFIAYDSVDCSTNPCEIRWQDHTTKDGARKHSIKVWNALAGGVAIREDTASTVADLEFFDYRLDDGKCGWYIPNAGADNIELNSHAWPNLDSDQRKACAAHEMGHAHRLGHSTKKQLMDACAACRNPLRKKPRKHDKKDYNQIW